MPAPYAAVEEHGSFPTLRAFDNDLSQYRAIAVMIDIW